MIVSVVVITYNHAKYIRQCLDSILAQEVNFEYSIVVGDDASTDGTQDILREYQQQFPVKFSLILNSQNEGISKNYQNVLKQCRGKYVALCEGDDYWCDELKLKRQVDFLELHPNYGFVGSKCFKLFPYGQLVLDNYDSNPSAPIENEWELWGNAFDSAKYGPVTRTATICFRKSLIESYLDIVGVGNDLVLQTILSKFSLFAKFHKPMAVFRVGQGVSTDERNLKKELYYNEWYVQNRLLQKQLFPIDCPWDEDELKDREDYIFLKDALKRFDYKEVCRRRKIIRTDIYRNKSYAKYSNSRFVAYGLGLLLRIRGKL